ncbi:transposase [Streptomyces sp. T12]|uniref:transposase n=1 Tax=Streptomyces sp. T12 TaxID=477697 RepID=UPI0035A3C4EB
MDHRVVDHGGVIRRHELTDQEWALPAPLIPRAATGRPRVSDRQVINGTVYKIRTGIPGVTCRTATAHGRPSPPASAVTPPRSRRPP